METIKDKIAKGMINLNEISISIYNLKKAHKKYLAENTAVGDRKAIKILKIINSLSALRSDIDSEIDTLMDKVYFLNDCLDLEV